jgi:hypothetical protein
MPAMCVIFKRLEVTLLKVKKKEREKLILAMYFIF